MLANNIQNLLPIIGTHCQGILVCGLIMVSAIIVAIGLLKPLLFNKIKNKHIRGSVIAFTNVAACFGTVLVYFLLNGISFEYYIAAAVSLSVSCIVIYWLYEFTRLRSLIEVIGTIVLRKVLKVSLFALSTEDVEAVKTELQKTGAELKAHAKKELKKAAEDKDLRTL